MLKNQKKNLFGIIALVLIVMAIFFQKKYVNNYFHNIKEKQEPDTIYIMQIGHAHGVSSTRNKALKVFKSLVEEQTNGGILVNIYPNGQLGTELNMHEEVENGTLQAVWGGEFDMIPHLIIFTLPFLAENEKEMERLLDSDFMMEICKEAENKGVAVLGIGSGGGFRQFSNNEHPITSPDDLKGLKMRINEIDTIGRTMQALGADVTLVPYNDLYASLKAGTADGQENPWSNIVSMRFYEVQKYFTEVNYQFHPNPFYVNSDWLHSLPEKYQSTLESCAKSMIKHEREYEKNNQNKMLDQIKPYAEINILTEEERKNFREAVQVVYDYYLEKGLVTQEELDKMQDIMVGNE